MGRQLRKVAENWQHPKNENGNYIPLLDGKFSERLSKWEEENAQWEKGFSDDWNGGWKPREADELNMTFAEWDGEKPVKEDYMPECCELILDCVLYILISTFAYRDKFLRQL